MGTEPTQVGNAVLGTWLVDKPRNGYYKAKKFVGAGTPYFRMGDLFAHDRIPAKIEGLQEMECTETEVDRHRLVPWELLFCRTSVAAEGVGKCSIVREVRDPVIPASNMIRATVDPAKADPRFVYYWFSSASGATQLRSRTRGAAVFTITGADLAASRVPDIHPSAQARIAEALWAIDDLVENYQRRVEVLEEMARALYREWFVYFRFPGYDQATFVDSDLGPIPHGWEVSVLEAVVEQRRATVGPGDVDGDTPLVGLEHIPRRRLTLDDWTTAEGVGSRKTCFEAGDILFGKIRPYFHKVAVAPTAGICSTDALVFDVSGPHRGLAIMALSSDEVVAYATQTANGTKMPRANWEVMKSHPVVLPPEWLTVRFTEIVNDLSGMATSLMFGAKRLGEMRDRLLPKLVIGLIDVSDLDLDEFLGEART